MSDPIQEALEESLKDFQSVPKIKPQTVTLDDDSMSMLRQFANRKPVKDKDVSARVFLAGLLIWFSWLGVNVMAGLEIGTDRVAFAFKPDANFLATLGYMAIGAASVVTGTAVAEKLTADKKPKG